MHVPRILKGLLDSGVLSVRILAGRRFRDAGKTHAEDWSSRATGLCPHTVYWETVQVVLVVNCTKALGGPSRARQDDVQ